MMVGISWR